MSTAIQLRLLGTLLVVAVVWMLWLGLSSGGAVPCDRMPGAQYEEGSYVTEKQADQWTEYAMCLVHDSLKEPTATVRIP